MTAPWGLAELVDGVIAFTVFEVAALAVYYRVTGGGVWLRDIGLNLASGLCLMLALRGAVHDAGFPWIALCLLMAGLAHTADVCRRWRRASPALSVSLKVSP